MNNSLANLSLEMASHIKGVAFRNAIKKLPVNLLSLPQDELESLVRPTKTDELLRLALWRLVKKAQKKQPTNWTIDPKLVFLNYCSYTHWHDGILNNPSKLAWLLRPVL